MKNLILVLLAAIAGFAGGTIANSNLGAKSHAGMGEVIRANRVELVNDSGQVLAFWGMDAKDNLVLAFRGREQLLQPANGSGLDSGKNAGVGNQGHTLLSFGVASYGKPFLSLNARDGDVRAELALTEFDKPKLLMWDERSVRVSLGLLQSDTVERTDDDWALKFHPEMAHIGMFADYKHENIKGDLFVQRKKVRFPN